MYSVCRKVQLVGIIYNKQGRGSSETLVPTYKTEIRPEDHNLKVYFLSSKLVSIKKFVFRRQGVIKLCEIESSLKDACSFNL